MALSPNQQRQSTEGRKHCVLNLQKSQLWQLMVHRTSSQLLMSCGKCDVQSVRRNYSLTVRDFEADRQKDLERAQMLKTTADGKTPRLVICRNLWLYRLDLHTWLSCAGFSFLSLPSQPIGCEEHLRNDLFCVVSDTTHARLTALCPGLPG